MQHLDFWSAEVELLFVDFTLYYCEINQKKHLIFDGIDDLLHLQQLYCGVSLLVHYFFHLSHNSTFTVNPFEILSVMNTCSW